jgi:hypothetical protein
MATPPATRLEEQMRGTMVRNAHLVSAVGASGPGPGGSWRIRSLSVCALEATSKPTS